MNILITGSDGYIGSNLVRSLGSEYKITTLNRSILDITNYEALKEWINNKFFDVVIHTAIKGGSRLKIDSSEIIDTNLSMYYNLLKCKNHYYKFINIGSGAEIHSPFSYYGISKRTIFESIKDKNNFYSLRIFGIFDKNEINTRFIKSNIIRYIQNKQIIIHQNKIMDFIFFEDFNKIIDYYLKNNNPPKNTDCVYDHKYSLLDIAKLINVLGDYRVDIDIKNNEYDPGYFGNYHDLGIDYHGLTYGIEKTYKELKNEKDMVCSQ